MVAAAGASACTMTVHVPMNSEYKLACGVGEDTRVEVRMDEMENYGHAKGEKKWRSRAEKG